MNCKALVDCFEDQKESILDNNTVRSYGMIVPYKQGNSNQIFESYFTVFARDLKTAIEEAFKEMSKYVSQEMLLNSKFPRIRINYKGIQEYSGK
jgi:hypothetical protein